MRSIYNIKNTLASWDEECMLQSVFAIMLSLGTLYLCVFRVTCAVKKPAPFSEVHVNA